jgi:Fe-S cluster biogenesis protein NfuA
VVIEDAMTEQTSASDQPITDRQITEQPVTLSTTGASNTDAGEPVDLAMLEATLDYIRPALQADGGDLVLLGVDEGVVNLQMVGACGGCPMSMMTLKAGIERILTDRVPGVKEVVAI